MDHQPHSTDEEKEIQKDYSDYFLAPKFKGTRFEQHGIPFSFLKDLEHIEKTLFEAIKAFYLEDTKKKRLPFNLEQSVSLVLKGIDKGSAVALIQAERPYSATPVDPIVKPLLDRAKNGMISVVKATQDPTISDDDIAKLLPPKALEMLSRFGKGFGENEQLDFTHGPRKKPVVFNKKTQEKLTQVFVKTSRESFKEIILRGGIYEVSQTQKCFYIKPLKGAAIKCALKRNINDPVTEALRHYLDGEKVKICGVARLKHGHIKEVIEVMSISPLKPRDIGQRLFELRNRKKGWLGPDSIPPSESGLDWLVEQFDKYYPENLPLPYLAPSETNGIIAEWPIGENEASVEFFFETRKGEWLGYRDDFENDDCKELDFNLPDSWFWLVDEIKEMERVASK